MLHQKNGEPRPRNKKPHPRSGESSRIIQAFERYYALGPGRSLRKLAEKEDFDLRTLEYWSSKFNWQERVKERCREEELAAREEAKRQAAAMARRRLIRAQTMQEAGMAIIVRADVASLSTEEARALLKNAQQLLDSGMRAERLELGESTDNRALVPSKPIQEMTDEELQEYIALLEAS